jgi:hypothetical protein
MANFIGGWIGSLFKPKETITQTVIPAQTQPSVTYVDVGTKDTVRTGGYTVVGGGGAASGGGGGYATQLQGVTPEQVQGLEAAQGRTTTVVGGRQEAISRARGLTPQQIAQARSSDNAPQQFSGSVQEFDVRNGQQTEIKEGLFVRGERTGEIRIDQETGEKYAVVLKPSRFQFVNKERGTVQDIILGEEGATITESMGLNMPTLFPEQEPTQQERRLAEVTARQQLPFGERLKVAYKSALPTGAKFNVYSVLRAGVETGQFVMEKVIGKIGDNKLNLPPNVESFIKKPVSIAPFERFITSTFYLTPIAISTAQIERELFSVTKVGVIGSAQQTAAGTTKVNARFIAERAGRDVQGVVTSQSKYLGTTNKGDIFVAGARGTTYNIGAQFPTGNILIKSGTSFKTTELLRINSQGLLFESRGVGVSVREGLKTFFQSKSISVTRGDWTGQFGATISPKTSDAISFGLIKNRPGVSQEVIELTGIKSTGIAKTFFQDKLGQFGSVGSQTGMAPLIKLSGGSQGISVNIGQSIAMEATRSAIRGTNFIPIQTPLQFIPSIIFGATQQAQTKTTAPSTIQNVITKQEVIPKGKVSNIPTQKIDSIQRGGSSQISSLLQKESPGQVPKQISISIQQESQKQIPRQIVIQTQVQRQSLKQISVNVPTQTFRRISPRVPSPKVPKTNIIPFFIKLPSAKQTSISMGVPVFVRRFGKWKFFGSYPTSKLALKVGKEYSLKTLGRSFYIGGKQPKSIVPQFRTKKEKGIGQIFIQKTKYPGGSTLGTFGEKREIQMFRRMKK